MPSRSPDCADRDRSGRNDPLSTLIRSRAQDRRLGSHVTASSDQGRTSMKPAAA